MSLCFEVAKDLDSIAGLPALLESHWAEMGLPDRLSANFSMYQGLCNENRLHLLIAQEDGRTIGYWVAFIGRHPHYDILTASMDVYYLLPEYRKGLNGIRLFMEAERTLKARGVQYILATSRLDSHNVDPIFERLGWKAARTVYEKRLGG